VKLTQILVKLRTFIPEEHSSTLGRVNENPEVFPASFSVSSAEIQDRTDNKSAYTTSSIKCYYVLTINYLTWSSTY
jgi:hypothetical protein